MDLRTKRGHVSPEVAACVWGGDCPWPMLLARPSSQYPLVMKSLFFPMKSLYFPPQMQWGFCCGSCWLCWCSSWGLYVPQAPPTSKPPGMTCVDLPGEERGIQVLRSQPNPRFCSDLWGSLQCRSALQPLPDHSLELEVVGQVSRKVTCRQRWRVIITAQLPSSQRKDRHTAGFGGIMSSSLWQHSGSPQVFGPQFSWSQVANCALESRALVLGVPGHQGGQELKCREMLRFSISRGCLDQGRPGGFN